MSSPLSAQTIALVKATVPALEAHGLEITRRMYQRMFANEAIRDLFNQSHHGETGSQPKALASAILAYAQNIERLEVLGPAVERIAQKHVGLQILPEHYPAVAESLLGAIKDILGDAATNEILAAWGEAYWFLANILIGREKQIYDTTAAASGGWTGWRDFVVESKQRESDIITSFVLRPRDSGPVIRHRPGQYLTFWLEVPGHHPLKRNYSISSTPDDRTYRISVKREPGGVVSNWLHDTVESGAILKAAPPAGEFFLPENPERPIVLISGGVGLTPMVSMLETAVRAGREFPIQHIHGTLNGATHARTLLASTSDTTTFYAKPRAEDRAGHDYDHAGFIGIDWLRQHTPLAEADYFLCGPRPFLRTYVNGLIEAGVPASRVHYEFFGPADELLAA
jgi:nitric oxide dioxygenase